MPKVDKLGPKVGKSPVPQVTWANPPVTSHPGISSRDTLQLPYVAPTIGNIIQGGPGAFLPLAQGILGRTSVAALASTPAGDVTSVALRQGGTALGQTLGTFVSRVSPFLLLASLESSTPRINNTATASPPNPWATPPAGLASARTWNAYAEARRTFPSAGEARDAYRRRNIWSLYQGGQ